MRNAQKLALMAIFAGMEEAKDVAPQSRSPQPSPEPKAGRPIQVDPLWLVTRGTKGRA